MTLTEFVLARIAEDEETARAAKHGPVWYSYFRQVLVDGGEQDRAEVCSVHTRYDARHIARHDPARVLVECAAKRRIVELHDEHKIHGHLELHCRSCREDDYPCSTLRQLAMSYADHPDYLTGWRPETG